MTQASVYDGIPDYGMLYDHVTAYVTRPDIPFYLAEAADAAGTGAVLELGCGTGRVLVPLARAGHTITGVDESEAMLARCRTKVAALPPETRERVSLYRADARDFTVPRDGGFALAIAPFRLLQHLVAPSDQLRVLSSLRTHLAPGGRLVFDVFNPHYPLMASDRSAEKEDMPEHALPDGRSMRRTVRIPAVHWREQTSDVEIVYYVRGTDGEETRSVQAFQMRWFGPAELEHLLARAGFRVTVMYGDFERGALRDESPEIVVVAERDEH